MKDMKETDVVHGAHPTAPVEVVSEQACAVSEAGDCGSGGAATLNTAPPATSDAVSFDVAALAATVDQKLEQGLWTSLQLPSEAKVASEEEAAPAFLSGPWDELAEDLIDLLLRVRAMETGLDGV